MNIILIIVIHVSYVDRDEARMLAFRYIIEDFCCCNELLLGVQCCYKQKAILCEFSLAVGYDTSVRIILLECIIADLVSSAFHSLFKN
jgi:hypothetical protein